MGRNYGQSERVHTVGYHPQVGRHIPKNTSQHENRTLRYLTSFRSGTNKWLMLGGSSHLFYREGKFGFILMCSLA